MVGVRTGDRGIDKHGEREADVRAGRGHPREGHDPRRRRARQSHEAARPAPGARRRTRAAAVRDRHQGTVGGPDGSAGARAPSSTRWAFRSAWTSSAAASSTRCRTGVLSVGFVSGLDYRDPMFDPHVTFQHFKRHPLVAPLLEGGQMVRYGAKALPEGGWHTIPRVYADGVLIAGDAGGFLNSMRLKGDPPRDAHRHARRRDGVRRGARRRRRRPARLQSYAAAIDAKRRAHRALPGAQRAPELQPRPRRRRAVLRALAGDGRLVVSRPDACACGLRAHGDDRGLLQGRPPRSGRAGEAGEDRSAC